MDAFDTGKKRDSLAPLLMIVVLAVLGCAEKKPRKNVVLITLDGLRQDHVSLFGYSRPTTPNIDRLGRMGMIWRQVIVSGCSTKASLTSLLTSLDYRYHQIQAHDGVLADGFVTLAESFRSAGYDTSAIVATPMLKVALNYDQGFDFYHDFSSSDEGYIHADQVARVTLEHLSNLTRSTHQPKPFFFYLHFEEPHPPWTAPSPWLNREEPATRFFGKGCTYIPKASEIDSISPQHRENLIAKYDGALHSADAQIGRIVDRLEEKDLLRNTIVAISTDHGIELLDRYSATHGSNPFDEVVKGFLVLYDGTAPFSRQPAGGESGVQARIFDIGPTLLGLNGIEPPEGAQGLDLLREADRLPQFAFTDGYGVFSVRSTEFKLVRGDLPEETVPQFLKKNRYALFNLRNDPQETTDVKDLHPEVYSRFFKEFLQYQENLRRNYVAGTQVPLHQLDENTLRRLRSLGYIR